jgi:hypothetical protein
MDVAEVHKSEHHAPGSSHHDLRKRLIIIFVALKRNRSKMIPRFCVKNFRSCESAVSLLPPKIRPLPKPTRRLVVVDRPCFVEDQHADHISISSDRRRCWRRTQPTPQRVRRHASRRHPQAYLETRGAASGWPKLPYDMEDDATGAFSARANNWRQERLDRKRDQ